MLIEKGVFLLSKKEMIFLKRSKDWNKSKYERFIKEGRGQGELAQYKPWLTIQDIPSLGRATRLFGWKTKRIHHFFSDIETRYFYLLEWEDSVIDINEHYPLLDLRDVISDADLDKYKSEDGTDYVFTTTFLIKVQNSNGVYYLARAVKNASELEKKNVVERLEIERRYWKVKNIDWGIVTNKEILTTTTKNIEWIHSALDIDMDDIFAKNEKNYLCEILISKLANNLMSLREILKDFDSEYNLEMGTGILLFKYLIGTKKVIVDISKKIDLNLSPDAVIKTIKNVGGEIKEYDNNTEYAN